MTNGPLSKTKTCYMHIGEENNREVFVSANISVGFTIVDKRLEFQDKRFEQVIWLHQWMRDEIRKNFLIGVYQNHRMRKGSFVTLLFKNCESKFIGGDPSLSLTCYFYGRKERSKYAYIGIIYI